MIQHMLRHALAGLHRCLLAAVLAQAVPTIAQTSEAPDTPAPQERQCMARGWQRATVPVDGLQRGVLWQAPAGRWTRGAIVVLHGGGGQHFQWCVANADIVAPQVRFSEMALAEGFAVFLLDSSDRVTDRAGRACGKVWDDEVRPRANLDLPFIGQVLRQLIPALRPPGSAGSLFLTGLSSGGYMTVRAATHFDDVVTAFAPVASGDPYGWHRRCEPGLAARRSVHGAGFDNETGRQIVEPDACLSAQLDHEQPWDSARPAAKPPFRLFRHEQDGINDRSCSIKVSDGLRRHGHPGPPDFVLQGGARSLANHLWQDAYNRPILEFLAAPHER